MKKLRPMDPRARENVGAKTLQPPDWRAHLPSGSAWLRGPPQRGTPQRVSPKPQSAEAACAQPASASASKESATPFSPQEAKGTPAPPCTDRAEAAACESADATALHPVPGDLEEAREVEAKKTGPFTLFVSSTTLVTVLAELPEQLRRPVLDVFLGQGSLAVDAPRPA